MKEVTEALLFAQLSICISFRRIQLRYRLLGYVRSMFHCFGSNTLNNKDAIMPNVRFKLYIYVCVCVCVYLRYSYAGGRRESEF